MNIYFIIDTRENHILNELKIEFSKQNTLAGRGDINYQIHQMYAGDYLICDKDGRILCVIERKTLGDYVDSFKTGRHENAKKLIEMRERTNCDIYYLIEGAIDPNLNTLIHRMPYKNILASIRHFELRDNFKIMRTKNATHTAKELRFLCEIYSDLADSEDFREVKGEPWLEVLSGMIPSAEKSAEQQTIAIWQTFKGLNAAAAVLAEKYTLGQLVTGQLDGIEELKVNNRRINKNVISLLKSEHDKDQQAKMLSCVKGISKKTASLILESFTIADFLDDEKTEEIINMKIGNRNFGPKKYELIRQLFKIA